jgi:hypothetical protein
MYCNQQADEFCGSTLSEMNSEELNRNGQTLLETLQLKKMDSNECEDLESEIEDKT